MRNRLLLATLVGVLFAAPANAAFISVTDVAANTITLTAGDFEGGFFVDGVLLTTGIGNSNSITVADGGVHTITANWVELGQTGAPVNILFSALGAPTLVTSYLRLQNNVSGALTGDFGGFTGATYFVTGLPTNLQNGQTVNAGLPFLSISMTSEVPEPLTLSLFGVGLIGFANRMRKRDTEA